MRASIVQQRISLQNSFFFSTIRCGAMHLLISYYIVDFERGKIMWSRECIVWYRLFAESSFSFRAIDRLCVLEVIYMAVVVIGLWFAVVFILFVRSFIFFFRNIFATVLLHLALMFSLVFMEEIDAKFLSAIAILKSTTYWKWIEWQEQHFCCFFSFSSLFSIYGFPIEFLR